MYTRYQTLNEAMDACNKDFECEKIYNIGCHTSPTVSRKVGFYLCKKGSNEIDDVGSCIHKKIQYCGMYC